MPERLYLRPTGFVDAPFGHDGKVARLAGGLAWFGAVELIRESGGRTELELIAVERIDERLPSLGAEAQAQWRNILAPRAPLALGARVVRLDQPQLVGILNIT